MCQIWPWTVCKTSPCSGRLEDFWAAMPQLTTNAAVALYPALITHMVVFHWAPLSRCSLLSEVTSCYVSHTHTHSKPQTHSLIIEGVNPHFSSACWIPGVPVEALSGFPELEEEEMTELEIRKCDIWTAGGGDIINL